MFLSFINGIDPDCNSGGDSSDRGKHRAFVQRALLRRKKGISERRFAVFNQLKLTEGVKPRPGLLKRKPGSLCRLRQRTERAGAQRLENFRDGLEDLAYAKLAAAAGLVPPEPPVKSMTDSCLVACSRSLKTVCI